MSSPISGAISTVGRPYPRRWPGVLWRSAVVGVAGATVAMAVATISTGAPRSLTEILSILVVVLLIGAPIGLLSAGIWLSLRRFVTRYRVLSRVLAGLAAAVVLFVIFVGTEAVTNPPAYLVMAAVAGFAFLTEPWVGWR